MCTRAHARSGPGRWGPSRKARSLELDWHSHSRTLFLPPAALLSPGLLACGGGVIAVSQVQREELEAGENRGVDFVSAGYSGPHSVPAPSLPPLLL